MWLYANVQTFKKILLLYTDVLPLDHQTLDLYTGKIVAVEGILSARERGVPFGRGLTHKISDSIACLSPDVDSRILYVYFAMLLGRPILSLAFFSSQFSYT